jgi:hypothetical protein
VAFALGVGGEGDRCAELGHHGRYVSVVQIISRCAKITAVNGRKGLLRSDGGVVI